MTMLKDSKTRS